MTRSGPHVVRLAGAAAATLTVMLSAQTPAYDIVLRHGTIIDGSGLPATGPMWRSPTDPSRASAICPAAARPTELDADGLVVAPGFINIHSHATPEGLPRAENMLTQGVTTEILNADGSGPLDLARAT